MTSQESQSNQGNPQEFAIKICYDELPMIYEQAAEALVLAMRILRESTHRQLRSEHLRKNRKPNSAYILVFNEMLWILY